MPFLKSINRKDKGAITSTPLRRFNRLSQHHKNIILSYAVATFIETLPTACHLCSSVYSSFPEADVLRKKKWAKPVNYINKTGIVIYILYLAKTISKILQSLFEVFYRNFIFIWCKFCEKIFKCCAVESKKF